jgi:seryl-tRNA synthetase
MTASSTEIAEARAEMTRRLIENRYLLASGVPGVFGRGPVMHDLLRRLEALIDVLCKDERLERVNFPPIMPREVMRRTGYMENFPQLCGSIHSFTGDERQHAPLLERVNAGASWSEYLQQTDVVLTPAACHPLYPTLEGQTLPEGGRLFDLTGYCFRHEPSDDPARMQSFQIHENIRLGTPEEVLAWRDGWAERGKAMLESLGLPVHRDTANDPFFGRGGRMMRASQREQALKFEILVPIWSEDAPTAVASFNYHQDHFSHVFHILSHRGEIAHSACLGFGLERIAIGLFRVHGLDPKKWPNEVRRRLWP